jgi:hypothetical protein
MICGIKDFLNDIDSVLDSTMYIFNKSKVCITETKPTVLKHQRKWFDNECFQLKKNKNYHLRRYQE